MNNFINYQIAIIPENAELIDELNEKVLNLSSDKKPTSNNKTESKSDSNAPSLATIKNLISAAKKEHGKDFIIAAFEEFDVEEEKTMVAMLKNLDEDNYADFADFLKEGPKKSKSAADDLIDELDGNDDDELDDDDDDLEEAELTAEAVATQVKAYASANSADEAKAAMKKVGIAKLSQVKELTPAKLAKLFKLTQV